MVVRFETQVTIGVFFGLETPGAPFIDAKSHF